MATGEIEWGWGYGPDMFDDGEQDRVIASSGHEWTWVPPELRDGFLLSGFHVYLGGGLEGECLTDVECVLLRLGVPYKKVLLRRDYATDDLVYGFHRCYHRLDDSGRKKE